MCRRHTAGRDGVEGGREGGREGGKEGRVGGEGEREGGRGGREGGEGGREGGRDIIMERQRYIGMHNDSTIICVMIELT